MAASYTYDPYGNLATKTGSADTPVRWNGQVQDTDTGLYYLRARYYDPKTSQFISIDPIASVTGQKYNYAFGNPLNRMDPSGLISYGLCLSGSWGAMFGGYGQVCVVEAINDVDGTFTVGFTETLGGGVQTPSAGIAGNIQVSTARSVDQLAGPFTYGGLSVMGGPSFGGSVFGGTSCGGPDDRVAGGEVNFGVGAAALLPSPLPAEIHGGRSNTWSQSSTPNPWGPNWGR